MIHSTSYEVDINLVREDILRYYMSMSPYSEPPLTRIPGRVAEEVLLIMAALDVSGAELSRRIGRSQSYTSARLRKEAAFTLTDFEAIADALGIDPVKLLARAVGSKN